MSKAKKVLILFLSMLKIGLFTFGGGYGMLALLKREFVDNKNWLTKEEFLNMVAIAESTPGPIAINSSTYIGYKVAKFWGSLFATIAVCIPSFVIIFVISLFLDQFLELKYVAYAFKGIQACVTFLILMAGIKMFKDIKKDVLSIVIMSATFVCVILLSLFAVNFSSVFYILIAGALGLFLYLIKHQIEKSKQKKSQPKTEEPKATSEEINAEETLEQFKETIAKKDKEEISAEKEIVEKEVKSKSTKTKKVSSKEKSSQTTIKVKVKNQSTKSSNKKVANTPTKKGDKQ